jgi:hypothetical protein
MSPIIWRDESRPTTLQQIDRITALNKIITDLYLSDKDDSNESDNISSRSATLDSLISGQMNAKYH